ISNAKMLLKEFFAIAQAISNTKDVDTLLKKIGILAQKLTKAEGSSLLLIDHTKKYLYFKTASGEKSTKLKKIIIPIDEGVAGWVVKNIKPVAINDAQKDPRFTGSVDKESGFKTKQILAIPLLVDGEVIGVCEVVNKVGVEPPEGFNEEDISILASLAGLAGSAIKNVKDLEQSKNLISKIIDFIVEYSEMLDPRLKNHALYTSRISFAIAKNLNLDEDTIKRLYYASMLHDFALPIAKEDFLTGIKHPSYAAQFLKGFQPFKDIESIILYHHEYYDGTGTYRLKKQDIPIESRILCLVEEIEAPRIMGVRGDDLTKQIEKIVENGYGTKFDPLVVDAFKKIK
ncbi:MAG: GAF domain-containing protein, partial [bacterium]|nr:GAF domain-containing protein [bacterium]